MNKGKKEENRCDEHEKSLFRNSYTIREVSAVGQNSDQSLDRDGTPVYPTIFHFSCISYSSYYILGIYSAWLLIHD